MKTSRGGCAEQMSRPSPATTSTAAPGRLIICVSHHQMRRKLYRNLEHPEICPEPTVVQFQLFCEEVKPSPSVPLHLYALDVFERQYFRGKKCEYYAARKRSLQFSKLKLPLLNFGPYLVVLETLGVSCQNCFRLKSMSRQV